ncbi:ATP-binding protein [Shewanella salipaludis]|uniref:histidine kinase n=1 Tax=Shewanella salipaludis TaxID=2723052 RepID=A0A972JI78_9GAMM|nr:ATP-binding protein [Shewanella salipaludis]NMH64718.1 GHKL domain-containing protein [Shewanella salipaludis]
MKTGAARTPPRAPWLKTGVLNSLKARLIVSALLLILLLLPAIGITLNDAFKQQVTTAARNELSAYVYSVLAVAEVDGDKLLMPEQLLENQFNLLQSGLYAIITKPEPGAVQEPKTGMLWHSNSFLGLEPPASLPAPAIGRGQFGRLALADKPYLIYSFSASFAGDAQGDEAIPSQARNFPITVHIIKDMADFERQNRLFTHKLWTSLLVIMLFLIIVQLVWLLWTLKPLAKFKRELAEVEQGKAMQLSTSYPRELQAVARQLNTLLDTEQHQRKRYRNALADLAHSLKTPLAVIQSQTDLSKSSSEQVAAINRIIGHQLKRAQSAAGASWHLGVTVAGLAEKLLRTLGKIYPQVGLQSHIDPQAQFRGDEADLAELLGNLLDNACKAASKRVSLDVAYEGDRLVFTIEDDGPGVPQAQESQIFERGIRADSYHQGHGIGLAIVRDLVDSYQGQLSLARSATLGGAKFSLSFKR